MKMSALTFRKAESRAAEYLNPFNSRSYSFNLRLRLLSTLNSSTSPTGLLLVRSRTRGRPMPAETPNIDPRVAARREASDKRPWDDVSSDAFGCRRRTESVPSDIPTAMCVSSGYTANCQNHLLSGQSVTTHRQRETYYWSRVAHRVHDVVIADIIHLDHVIKPPGQ
jgi:hypothetical protein